MIALRFIESVEMGIGRRYIDITAEFPTEEKMRVHVLGLNRDRRSRIKPLTNAEKRAQVEAELKRDPTQSDNAIAKKGATTL